MTVVVGTAGHIDHGKTTLLRALTGIDADRLPEERRRGMTIDVGYAHLALDDGRVIDFVDVPGHDRLVGNMLVGAGEIDAAMLVVAADDGPNAQTIEHLELLDALGLCDGLAVVTKADLATPDRISRVTDEVRGLLDQTRFRDAPVIAASAVTGRGLEEVRAVIAALADALDVRELGNPMGGARLAIDRAFPVKGRGTVVTGSLRGDSLEPGALLRLVPGGAAVRVREVQARGARVARVDGGRTAVLVGGVDAAELRRGRVLTADPGIVATSRLLVALGPPARPGEKRDGGARGAGSDPRAAIAGLGGTALRLHLGTDQVGAVVVRGPRESITLSDGRHVALLRLDAPVAAAAGDRFALRRPSPGETAAGGVILDPDPPRGISRRRLTPERAAALLQRQAGARLDLHGAVRRPGTTPELALDVATALDARGRALVAAHHEAEPDAPGMPLAALRSALALAARRLAALDAEAASLVARAAVDELVRSGRLARDGEVLRDPGRAGGLPPAVEAAMDRLEAALATVAPPGLGAAATAVGCPVAGVRALETRGRIVRVEDDLAWAAATHRDLVHRALALAARQPLSPAAFRDATGTSRKYVLPFLEDLGRRGLLRRTDAGHVLGDRAAALLRARAQRQSGGS